MATVAHAIKCWNSWICCSGFGISEAQNQSEARRWSVKCLLFLFPNASAGKRKSTRRQFKEWVNISLLNTDTHTQSSVIYEKNNHILYPIWPLTLYQDSRNRPGYVDTDAIIESIDTQVNNVFYLPGSLFIKQKCVQYALNWTNNTC